MNPNWIRKNPPTTKVIYSLSLLPDYLFVILQKLGKPRCTYLGGSESLTSGNPPVRPIVALRTIVA
jgi:hypothetical protein